MNKILRTTANSQLNSMNSKQKMVDYARNYRRDKSFLAKKSVAKSHAKTYVNDLSDNDKQGLLEMLKLINKRKQELNK